MAIYCVLLEMDSAGFIKHVVDVCTSTPKEHMLCWIVSEAASISVALVFL
jgi:hypothetical protein